MFAQQTTTQTATVNTQEEHTEVTIDALGRVVIEGQNFKGDACSIMGDKLRAALGGGGSKDDKPDLHMTHEEDVEQEQNW